MALGVTMITALVIAFPMLPLGQQPSSSTGATPFSSLGASRKIPDGTALLAYP